MNKITLLTKYIISNRIHEKMMVLGKYVSRLDKRMYILNKEFIAKRETDIFWIMLNKVKPENRKVQAMNICQGYAVNYITNMGSMFRFTKV